MPRAIYCLMTTASYIVLNQPAMAQNTAPSSAAPVAAASESDANSGVADIIVTAQKREQRVQDVPISITAVSGAQLERQGITSTEDLAKVAPGFSYQIGAAGIPLFTIRGIGLNNGSPSISPTVSVYVDQVPLPFSLMTAGASLDVERVEVLKGPQGTLFGQNSTGGAINYIAAKPTDTLHAGFDLTYGRFNEVDAQGYVSGPITDTLSFRVAAQHEYRDPWQISQSRPGDQLGTRDFSAGRTLLDWKPSSRLKFELNANGWKDRSDTTAAQFVAFRAILPPPFGNTDSTIAVGNNVPAPNDARIADWDPGVSFRKNNWLYQFSLRADWSMTDAITLTSITSNIDFNAYIPSDTDGTAFDVFRPIIAARVKSFTQELRLLGDFKFAKVTAGVNYENDRTNEHDMTFYEGSNAGLGPFRYNRFDNIDIQHARTYAAFGNVEVPITRTLTVQAGARYTKQNRDYQGCLADGGDGGLAAAIALIPVITGTGAYNPTPSGQCVTLTSTFQPAGLITTSLDQHNVSWKAGLQWKPDRNVMVYGNVTRGFKAGGYVPLPAIFAGQLSPVTQEQVTAYEIGTKLSVLDRKIDINAAAFYYDYISKQLVGTEVFPFFGPLPQLTNIPKCNVRGAEIDVTLRPTRMWTIQAGATYVKSKVSQSYLSSDPYGNVIDVKGEEFPNTPKWQLIANTEYRIPLNSLEAFVGANVSYRSSTNSSFGENPVFAIPAYTLVDMRAGIGAADGRWTAEVWGKNVFNKFYTTFTVYAVDTVARTPGMPTTYGLTLRYRY